MLDKNWKINALRRVLGAEVISKGDERVFMCPKCRHRKPKLSVNISTDRFHCWICESEFSGKNLLPILRFGGRSHSSDARTYAEHLKTDKVNPHLNIKDLLRVKQGESAPAQQQLTLPEEFKPFKLDNPTEQKRYLQYLINRGISLDDCLKHRIGYCTSGEYSGRVIFPSFDRDARLNFFIGRLIYEESYQKYKIPNVSKDIIWNDYNIDWDSKIIVTEGPFDALKAGDNAIPLQGSSINESSELFSKIVMSGSPVIFALDEDAFNKQLKIIDKFLKYGVDCYFASLSGDKDLGACTKEHANEIVAKARYIESSTVTMKLKLERISA